MATGLGQTYRSSVLNYLFKNATTPYVTPLFVSLHTNDPGTDAGATASNNEVTTSGTAYGRVSIAATTAGFNATTTADPNVMTNLATVTYVVATAQYGSTANATGPVTNFGIFTASTGVTAASYVGRGSTNSQNVLTGNQASFAASSISITESPVSSTGLGQTFRKNLYDFLFRNQTTPRPTNYYFSLHTADPGTDGAAGNEVTTAGGTLYARSGPFASSSTTNFASAVNGNPCTIATAVAVAFPTAGASWGTVTYFGIYDAASAGNFLARGTITSQAITTGNTPSFAAGQIVISLNET